MKFGIHLGSVNPRFWGDVAAEADRLGFESLWIPEHVVVPLATTGSPHGGSDHPPIPSEVPIYDALGALCYLAARTTRIRLGTHVYNIGLRHPFLTARAATTVDVLSGGRFSFGVGASWLRAEWDAFGLDFDTRGARVDEALTVCRRLWTEDVIEHHGRFFDFGPTAFEPKPVQGSVPFHIGGDGPAAIRRAATIGAGWMPMNTALTDLPQAINDLNRLAESHGRTEPIEITLAGLVTDQRELASYVDAKVTRVIVQPWTSSREAVRGMRDFAEEFISTNP